MKLTKKTIEEVSKLEEELYNLISSGENFLLLPEKVGDIEIPKSVQFACAPFQGPLKKNKVLVAICLSANRKLSAQIEKKTYTDPEGTIEEMTKLINFGKVLFKCLIEKEKEEKK